MLLTFWERFYLCSMYLGIIMYIHGFLISVIVLSGRLWLLNNIMNVYSSLDGRVAKIGIVCCICFSNSSS